MTFNIIEDDSKASVVIDTALLFCAFHELGHLLIGHCQLIKSQALNALYAPAISTDELYDIYHLLEINADSFAAQRIVEKICANIMDRSHIDVLGYNNYNHFINDVVCGINIFFTVIGYLETDYFHSINPNEYNKTINIDRKFGSHPPSIVRNYAVLKALSRHLKLFIDYDLDVKKSITSRMGFLAYIIKNRIATSSLLDRYSHLCNKPYMNCKFKKPNDDRESCICSHKNINEILTQLSKLKILTQSSEGYKYSVSE